MPDGRVISVIAEPARTVSFYDPSDKLVSEDVPASYLIVWDFEASDA